MSQNCSLPNIRFIKNARQKRTRDGVITAAQIIKAFAHHLTSFAIGFGISIVSPTHACSVLGGVRRGSKNQARCSITCSRPSVYKTIFGPHLCIGCVRRFICRFQENGCVDVHSLVWCERKKHHSAIIYNTIGHGLMRTTNKSTGHGCDIYRTTTSSTTVGRKQGVKSYTR